MKEKESKASLIFLIAFGVVVSAYVLFCAIIGRMDGMVK